MDNIMFCRNGTITINDWATGCWVKRGQEIGARPENYWFVGAGNSPLRGSFGRKTRKMAVAAVYEQLISASR